MRFSNGERPCQLHFEASVVLLTGERMNVITACMHGLFPELEVNSAHQALKAGGAIRTRVGSSIHFEPYARILMGEGCRGR